MSDLIFRADRFAAQAHASINQRRKYTNDPYIVHPRAVAERVRQVPHTDAMIAAALLHDVVEDTPVELDQIRTEFGDEVARLVNELTDQATLRMGNRSARKAFERDRIAGISPQAKTIKLADLTDNLLSISEHDPDFAPVYVREKADLLAVMQDADPAMLARATETLEQCRQALHVRAGAQPRKTA